MLERLDRAFDSQRRIFANVSHELRTPLTINRALIEVALTDPDVGDDLRQLGAALLAVNESHERLIDGLITLAASEGRIGDPVAVDARAVVLHVLDEVADDAARAGVELRPHLRPVPIEGEPLLLERLVRNLVDNAIHYNLPAGGWVSVSLGEEGGHAVLVVENTGERIPAYAVPNLFQPFRRLSSYDRLAIRERVQRQGAGLGLSIVLAIARAHGGDVDAAPRPEGGLMVRVIVPAQPQSAQGHRGARVGDRAPGLVGGASCVLE